MTKHKKVKRDWGQPQPAEKPAEVAQPVPAVQQEQEPRSRYEGIQYPDEAEQTDVLPPGIDLEGMTKAEIASFAVRQFGRWPEDGRKEQMIDAVKTQLRGGRPMYARG